MGIKKKQAGFTLVELLAVIVILGILLLMALPSFVQVQTIWRNHVCIENRRRLLMVIEADLACEDNADANELVLSYEMLEHYRLAYEQDCPYGGEWKIDRDGGKRVITCTECDIE